MVTAGRMIPHDAYTPPGALLFFDAIPPGHVGIYVGNGQMIDSPTAGSVVRQEPIWRTLVGAVLP